ncbi:chemotaxis-specific protein-glutamate methyltransferase CheB [Solimicrobium silvestre]|uniref:Protein-glutamate methylesterase/protein-glutamine glutaminase n=1 Tax=Solimicrobium silvestre TaxID=2099400 RepID=A0A2S9H5G5_9BURK|nr:chemotaxis-specific protein-glutamate methyltransferase CheB [Solimicrobium silvestre]PRC95173.1 Chemotaxis response regulator containing a CheY-like receiver domain and a methylesterase domain [Solimicrobium silvestre]
MSRLRVLVVEDSLTVRKRLCEVLSMDPDIILVGEAEDGKQGIELCMALRPDVISLDMMLPVMSGLAATEYIMAYCPTPILIVSSSFNRGEIFKTYEALAAGAVELMEKPTDQDGEGEWERRYIAMLKLVARVKVVTHLRGRKGALQEPAPALAPVPVFIPTLASQPRMPCAMRLVAIGASTGGPSALVNVLRALPADFPLPVLIVIHISEPFETAFAEWLDAQTPHKVRIASEGQLLNKPGVFIAPAEHHLIVRDRRLHITNDPERYSCRPSVDVLFESVALDYGASAVACLLTGMGQDGARGLLALHQAGGITIAQDEASCVVYGMPREAALLGAAQRVLPLSEIGPALATLGRIAP